MVDCPFQWSTGTWSACSASCGPGEQLRWIRCEQRDSFGTVRVFEPISKQCVGLERPPAVQFCNLGDSQTTLSEKARKFTSISGSCAPIYGTFDGAQSLPLIQPMQSASANLTPGEKEGRGKESKISTSFHEATQEEERPNPNDSKSPMSSHRKLTLNVGGLANLYEGTSIKVKCPIREGIDRRQIFWVKDGQQIVDDGKFCRTNLEPLCFILY